MYCLDTNIAIDIFRGDMLIKSKVEKLIEMGDVFVTPITLYELYKGAYLSRDMNKSLLIMDNFKNSFGLLDFDETSCKECGRLFIYLQRKGKAIPEGDIMIASIAKSNNVVLITRDKKHFENTGVEVEVW